MLTKMKQDRIVWDIDLKFSEIMFQNALIRSSKSSLFGLESCGVVQRSPIIL